jgi:hypothetical protein
MCGPEADLLTVCAQLAAEDVGVASNVGNKGSRELFHAVSECWDDENVLRVTRRADRVRRQTDGEDEGTDSRNVGIVTASSIDDIEEQVDSSTDRVRKGLFDCRD